MVHLIISKTRQGITNPTHQIDTTNYSAPKLFRPACIIQIFQMACWLKQVIYHIKFLHGRTFKSWLDFQPSGRNISSRPDGWRLKRNSCFVVTGPLRTLWLLYCTLCSATCFDQLWSLSSSDLTINWLCFPARSFQYQKWNIHKSSKSESKMNVLAVNLVPLLLSYCPAAALLSALARPPAPASPAPGKACPAWSSPCSPWRPVKATSLVSGAWWNSLLLFRRMSAWLELILTDSFTCLFKQLLKLPKAVIVKSHFHPYFNLVDFEH